MSRITAWPTLPAADLCLHWAADYPSLESAVAHAVWYANKLVKRADRSTKRTVYDLKDEHLRRHQHHLTEGRITRIERDDCFTCYGSDADCWDCGGSGIYRERTLYLHDLMIAGQRYLFHSYLEPRIVSPQRAVDAATFGVPLSAAEEAALALPLAGLVRVLEYALFGQETVLMVTRFGERKEHAWTTNFATRY